MTNALSFLIFLFLSYIYIFYFFFFKYCNLYPLAPQFPSFLLQVWKEAAHRFWVPCWSSDIFPPHLSWIAAIFFFPLNWCFLQHLSKSCTAQYPTPRVHFCTLHFIYFYPLESLSNFSYCLVIPQKFLAKLSKNSNNPRWITPVNTYNKTLIHLYSSASKEDSAQGYPIQIIQIFCNPLGTQTNPFYMGG